MRSKHSSEPVNHARLVLAQTFLKRSTKMLERVSSAASAEALKTALSSPTDVGGVVSLLSDLAPLGIDLSAVDPFVEAMARGAAVKQELLVSGGGGLTSSQVSRFRHYAASRGQAPYPARSPGGTERVRRIRISGLPVLCG